MLSLRSAKPPTSLSEMEDKRFYRVADGPHKNLFFMYSFGHARKLYTPEQIAAYVDRSSLLGSLGGDRRNGKQVPISISGALFSKIPTGPAMPAPARTPPEAALEALDHIDLLREALCADFQGAGYEVGAGRRPTIIPAACDVKYIDKYTFEEAADGSWSEIEDASGFVEVAISAEMEELPQIDDGSADFFIACHVIEHVSDVISAILETCRKLKPDGRLFLVVPHKNYMFDRNRPVTPLTHFIADYNTDPTPTLEHHLEFCRLARKAKNWEAAGLERFERGADVHAHVFTPDSLRELLQYMTDARHIGGYEVMEARQVEATVEFYAMIRPL